MPGFHSVLLLVLAGEQQEAPPTSALSGCRRVRVSRAGAVGLLLWLPALQVRGQSTPGVHTTQRGDGTPSPRPSCASTRAHGWERSASPQERTAEGESGEFWLLFTVTAREVCSSAHHARWGPLLSEGEWA